MKDASIKRAPTLVLKAIIVLIAVAVLILCFFLFPGIYRELQGVPVPPAVLSTGLIAFYATPIPFFFALYQSLKLLHVIDRNNAFSERSIQALGNIKYCGIAISVFYAFGMPLVFVLADLDDAPGAILIGAAVTCIPLVVSTFAAVLQKLVQSAVVLKTENDLTV